MLISIIELEEFLEDLESDYHSQRKLIIRDKQTSTSYHFSKGMSIGAIDAIKKVQKWIKKRETENNTTR
jgi:hypothetical protein